MVIHKWTNLISKFSVFSSPTGFCHNSEVLTVIKKNFDLCCFLRTVMHVQTLLFQELRVDTFVHKRCYFSCLHTKKGCG